MFDIFLDALTDTFLDSLKILLFLFITYLVMEYIGHKANSQMQRAVQKAGKFGPVLGGLLGAFPQCGFSTAAATLYGGRIITLGTMLAIFWSTSDEMLPIMISEKAPLLLVLEVIGLKIVIAIIFGFLIDLIFSRNTGKAKMGRRQQKITTTNTLCENGLCKCNQVILKATIKHTLTTIGFIFLVSLVLNLIVAFVGEDAIAGIVSNRPILGPVLSGIVGLIPNCAASVVITQLYLEGVMSFGTMMAGLLVGAGVGLIILAKENKDLKDNLKVVGILYGVGVLCGIVMDFLGIAL